MFKVSMVVLVVSKLCEKSMHFSMKLQQTVVYQRFIRLLLLSKSDHDIIVWVLYKIVWVATANNIAFLNNQYYYE